MLSDAATYFVRGRLGNYRIRGLLGAGATSQVYLAEHIFLRRLTAIKVLTCDFAQWPDFDLKNFESTAVAAARLHHPNIVDLYDMDEVRARPYLLMEWVDGKSLHFLLRHEGPLSPARALPILEDVTLALAHAHSAGTVHCDIKPGNILIDQKGTAKVTDFGLAQALNHADRGPLEGMIAGTPAYISPEQVLAQRPDQRSDLYSLGITLFEMLTGDCPFLGGSETDIFKLHLLPDRKDVVRRIPASAGPLAGIVGRLIARDPLARYQTARELLDHLHRLHDARSLPSREHRDRDLASALAHLRRLRRKENGPKTVGTRKGSLRAFPTQFPP